MNLSKDEVRQIIQNAPQGTNPADIVTGLVNRGYVLEGYNDAGGVAPATGNGGAIPQSDLMTIDNQNPDKKSVGGFLGNVVKSTGSLIGNTVKGIANVLNPHKENNTLYQLGSLGVGAAEKLIPGEQGAEQKANAVGQFFKERYGGGQQILDTLYKDPAGVLADLSTLLGVGGGALGAAGKVAKLGEATSAASKLGEAANIAGKAAEVTNPLNAVGILAGKPLAAAGNIGKKLAEYGSSSLTGLSPETIQTIIKSHADFSPSELQNFTRENIAQGVHGKITQRIEDLADTGKGYDAIRQSGQKATFEEQIVPKVLQKYGLSLDANGKILQTAESVPLKPGDVSALEHFISQYGNQQELSANGFLNTRKALSNLSEYDATKSDVSNRIARDLRSEYDKVGKAQIGGLKELDAQYAPEVELLKKIKKDYLNPDGTFKDGAINKIAGLSNKGKDAVLARLEKIEPGIGQKVKVVKAVEDIQAATGQKVGTYARAAFGGAGMATMNPAMIVAAIIASPKIATQILRGYGKFVGTDEAALNKILRAFGGAGNGIKNVTLPGFQAGRIRDVIRP